MKKLIIIALLLMSASSYAQIKSAALTASGLTCSMCSKSIYKALIKVPSIKNVTPDVEHSIFNIEFRDDANVSPDEVKKAVENAGFYVASMVVTATFDNTEVYNDAHVNMGGNTFHFLNVPKQTLQGAQAFRIVDKAFLPAGERKKYSKYTKMKCFETGTMEACCPKDKVTAKRVYHVTI